MDESAAATPGPQPTGEAPPGAVEPVVEQDLLVEDVSIDGMCGVY